MTEKKYGGEDFGSTLSELQKLAPLAVTVEGVRFEGPARKTGAILAMAGVGVELLADIAAHRVLLAKFVEHFNQTQRAGLTEDEIIDSDLNWFEAVDEAHSLLGIERTEPFEVTHRFAKVFNFDDIGQVLVKKDTNDADEPEVRLYFMPPGLGVCSIALGFESSEGLTGADKADKAFELVDREQAETIVRKTLKTIPAGLAE